jgi:hypothetical protein
MFYIYIYIYDKSYPYNNTNKCNNNRTFSSINWRTSTSLMMTCSYDIHVITLGYFDKSTLKSMEREMKNKQ